MKSAVILLFIFAIMISSFAQETNVFQVKKDSSVKEAWKILERESLFVNGTYNLNLGAIDTLFDSIEALNIKVSYEKPYLQLYTPSKKGESILHFYKKNNKGKPNLVYSQLYKITVDPSRYKKIPATPFESPINIYCWHKPLQKTDTILKVKLMDGLYLRASRKSSPSAVFAITSFKLNVKTKQQTILYSSSGPEFTPVMIEKIKSLQAGDQITLSEIKYKGVAKNAVETVAGPFEILIN